MQSGGVIKDCPAEKAAVKADKYEKLLTTFVTHFYFTLQWPSEFTDGFYSDFV